MAKSYTFTADSVPEFMENLTDALHELGYHCEPDPMMEGTDTYGLIVAKKQSVLDKVVKLRQDYEDKDENSEDFDTEEEAQELDDACDAIDGWIMILQDWKSIDFGASDNRYLNQIGLKVSKKKEEYTLTKI